MTPTWAPAGWEAVAVGPGSVLLCPEGAGATLAASAIVSCGPAPGGWDPEGLGRAVVAHASRRHPTDAMGPVVRDEDGVVLATWVLRRVEGPADHLVQLVAHAGARPAGAVVAELVLTCAAEHLDAHAGAIDALLAAVRALAGEGGTGPEAEPIAT